MSGADRGGKQTALFRKVCGEATLVNGGDIELERGHSGPGNGDNYQVETC